MSSINVSIEELRQLVEELGNYEYLANGPLTIRNVWWAKLEAAERLETAAEGLKRGPSTVGAMNIFRDVYGLGLHHAHQCAQLFNERGTEAACALAEHFFCEENSQKKSMAERLNGLLTSAL